MPGTEFQVGQCLVWSMRWGEACFMDQVDKTQPQHLKGREEKVLEEEKAEET